MHSVSRRTFLALVPMAALGVTGATAQTTGRLQVFKDPTCGCCALWVRHMEAHGFTASVTNVEDMTAIKAKHGVPASVRSCHTTLVNGYVVEGHVPATYVQRILTDRPTIAGIGVAGMPIGSPGMEVAGAKAQPFDVLSFDVKGETRLFASHRA